MTRHRIIGDPAHERRPAEGPEPVTRWDWIAYAVAAIALVFVAASEVRGAEREGETAWVVVACYRQPVDVGCRELGDPMDTRTDCAIAVQRVAVRMSGVRLSCAQVDRVRR